MLVTFQVPIYAAIIAVSGASGRGLVLGILGATCIMLVSGRPYDAVRSPAPSGLSTPVLGPIFLHFAARRFTELEAKFTARGLSADELEPTDYDVSGHHDWTPSIEGDSATLFLKRDAF